MENTGLSEQELREKTQASCMFVSVPRYLRDYANERGIAVSDMVRDHLELKFMGEHGYLLKKPPRRARTPKTPRGRIPAPEEHIRVVMACMPERQHRAKLDAFKRKVISKFPGKKSSSAIRIRALDAIYTAVCNGDLVLYTDMDRRNGHEDDGEYYYVSRPTEEHPATTVENAEQIISNTPRYSRVKRQ